MKAQDVGMPLFIVTVGILGACRSTVDQSNLRESIDLRTAVGDSQLLLLRAGDVTLWACNKGFPANGEFFVAAECTVQVPKTYAVSLNDFDSALRGQLGLVATLDPEEMLRGMQSEADAIEKRLLELRIKNSQDAARMESDLNALREHISNLEPRIDTYSEIKQHLVSTKDTRLYASQSAYKVAKKAYEIANRALVEEVKMRPSADLAARRAALKAKLEAELIPELVRCETAALAMHQGKSPAVYYACEIQCGCEMKTYCNGSLKEVDRHCYAHASASFFHYQARFSEPPSRSSLTRAYCTKEKTAYDHVVTGIDICRNGEHQLSKLRLTEDTLKFQCNRKEESAAESDLIACRDAKYIETLKIDRLVKRQIPE